MFKSRREEAYWVRMEAAALAKARQHPVHKANGDEQHYAGINYAMSFTKGLEHDGNTGLLKRREDFEHFRKAIDEGYIDAFTANVPASHASHNCGLPPHRSWVSPTARLGFDLEGPDAEAVTIPPAPALTSDELAYEMAEVYELALLRDVALTNFAPGNKCKSQELQDAVKRLNALAYKPGKSPGRPRIADKEGNIATDNAFRGSSPQVNVGPYLSQFLLIGNDQLGGPGKVDDGYVRYGALRIDQRVPIAKQQNYLTNCDDWLRAQNGENLRDDATLFDNGHRFITYPRDLATYVHDDALYEAYLNACLILLSMGTPCDPTPFDPGFANLSGQRDYYHACCGKSIPRKTEGFSLYGGPHILTLVTEVATRALKAVWYQKFNTHLRLRPEALAARIEKAKNIKTKFPQIGDLFFRFANAVNGVDDEDRKKDIIKQHPTCKDIKCLLEEIKDKNGGMNGNSEGTALLPMAFQEGSPMHPSYGAGHATVAGACVTILKAFFDTNAVFVWRKKKKGEGMEALFALHEHGDKPIRYEPNADGTKLIGTIGTTNDEFLTLEGELNKLAANISIGRNMAGVHYYSDYYDSVRMGEKIAIGILEEQALGYPNDPFILSVPTFDGYVVRIGAR